MVRLHVALVAVIVAFALSFFADPCGGGDLCLGGVVGVAAIAYAGIGIGALAAWRLGRRASPLLVWDSIPVTLAGATLFGSMGGGGVPLVMLGLAAAFVLGVPAAILAGREVAQHRIEPVVALVALAATALVGVEVIAVTVVGAMALAIGWALNRSSRPAQPPTPAHGVHSGPHGSDREE